MSRPPGELSWEGASEPGMMETLLEGTMESGGSGLRQLRLPRPGSVWGGGAGRGGCWETAFLLSYRRSEACRCSARTARQYVATIMISGMKKATKDPTSMKRSSFSTQLPFTNTFSSFSSPITGMGIEITERVRERGGERQRRRERGTERKRVKEIEGARERGERDREREGERGGERERHRERDREREREEGRRREEETREGEWEEGERDKGGKH